MSINNDDELRSRSDNTASLKAEIVTNLRRYEPLVSALVEAEVDDTGEELDPSDVNVSGRIATPMTAPGPESIPPALLIIEIYSFSSQHRGSATTSNFSVETGVTVTQGWIDQHNRAHGSNPDLAMGRIFDAISERAHVSFGVSGLTPRDGGGGGEMSSPMRGGARARVRTWEFSRTRG